MKTHTTHNERGDSAAHNLVILSLKRGEYLTDIIRGVNGEDNMFFTDGDNIAAALEFAACYNEAELRSLAESFGPDLEVQPNPSFYAIDAIRAQVEAEMPRPLGGFEREDDEDAHRAAHERRFMELVSKAAAKATEDPYRTQFHRDATVTFWSVFEQSWKRLPAALISDDDLATMSKKDRARVQCLTHK